MCVYKGLIIQWKKTTNQTMVHKTLHRTLKIEQHESGDEPNITPSVTDRASLKA